MTSERGAVTEIDGAFIKGWLRPGEGEGRDLQFDVLIAGAKGFNTTGAVIEMGGRLQFQVGIPKSLWDGRIRLLDVRISGDAAPLSGGPIIFDGGLFSPGRERAFGESTGLVGTEGGVAFDGKSLIRGWARDAADPNRTVVVEVWCGPEFVVSMTAEGPSDGSADQQGHGFELDLQDYLKGGPHHLQVRAAESNDALPGGMLKVGPFSKDGSLRVDGYLPDEEYERLLAELPLEQFAYASARMSPRRLVPRLVNRLCRERRALAGAKDLATLVLLDGEGADTVTAQLWRRQSYPATALQGGLKSAAELREIARSSMFVFFAAAGDLLHPSTAAVVMAEPDVDVVTWRRFCAVEARAGASGYVLRRPAFDPCTWRHGAVTDTTLAIRGTMIAECPDDVLEPLLAGRMHPLFFWLSGRGLAWRTHPEALTVQVGEGRRHPDRAEIAADLDCYEQILRAEGERFILSSTPEDLPFPFVLVPACRATKTSVIVCYKDKSETTIRCIRSIAEQHLTGGLELVLVDNQSRSSETQRITRAAAALLGDQRVVSLTYDAPFNHSAQNNLGVGAASGEVVVICNNDVVLSDPLCLEQLGAWALQEGVGAVGCRLEDMDRERASFGHCFRPISDDPFLPPLKESTDETYSRFVHACPGITLAIAAVARETYASMGGLDEKRYPIGHNDTEFMLRAGERGLTHLYLGHIGAVHARGSSRTGDDEDLQTLRVGQQYGGMLRHRFLQLGRELIEVAAERAKLTPATSLLKSEKLKEKALSGSEREKQLAILAMREDEMRRLRLAQAHNGPLGGGLSEEWGLVRSGTA
jgi:GT2 family glycosyltransferase